MITYWPGYDDATPTVLRTLRGASANAGSQLETYRHLGWIIIKMRIRLLIPPVA
jgi:hypothetical protein